MPKKRDATLFLADILEAIDNINEYIQDMDPDEFQNEKKTRDAVIRNLEIIGRGVIYRALLLIHK